MIPRQELTERFEGRHLGPREAEIEAMLAALGYDAVEALIADAVPASIRSEELAGLPEAVSEVELARRLRTLAGQNATARSYIGMGYSEVVTPPVILRNILENPGWYTQYTPYQAEISQGRLEALLNFQTMIIDLTGLPVANASLLDEGSAAAEAMSLLLNLAEDGRNVFLVDEGCHPQTIAVVETRARPLGIEIRTFDPASEGTGQDAFGILLAYPTTAGEVRELEPAARGAHEAGAGVAVACDLLALTLLTPPGEFGADIAVGSSQRFGVPMGFGGPHAAFFAARRELSRALPGRIIGISRDASGQPALRMALQTREQHIRRERATSNICTAQVLLAVMASMYAVYHGPQGLRRIARRIHELTRTLAAGLRDHGHEILHRHFFDTLRVRPGGPGGSTVLARAGEAGINLRDYGDGTLGIALDEAVGPEELLALLALFEAPGATARDGACLARLSEGLAEPDALFEAVRRTSGYLEHPVFRRHRSETEMLRYMRRLESRDLSLATSMIPLGSCTMKLNATSEMAALSWPEFSGMHPFVPLAQAGGYMEIIRSLGAWLGAISGLEAVSLQPNSGAQGEYAGLLVVRAYHESRGEGHRDVCLIPSSAHGTNPASAAMAGMKVVVVGCDKRGNVDLAELTAKAKAHSERLAAFMITYPSTHGVFEEGIREVSETVHRHGGQVYLDGANLNAQVGLCRPGDYGADVCHINLHKTFAIPHGGGGPGMGPICAAPHLAPFLPGHPLAPTGGAEAIGPVASAPWGSASILLISWAYIALLGREGVRRASEIAILNANYMVKRLEDHFDVLYRGPGGRVAHEFILDLRPFRRSAGVTDRGHREAAHGLRVPRAHDVLPGPGHDDGRADGIGIDGGARPLRGGADLDPQGDPPDRVGGDGPEKQSAEECPTHGGGARLERVGASLLA